MRAGVDGTRASALYHAGELLFATGLGTLVPLIGFILVIVAQSIRIVRLAARPDRGIRRRMNRAAAVSAQAAKWGLAATMTVFAITLVDRQAEILAAVSYMIWALLNLAQQATSISQADLTGNQGLRKLRQ